MLHPRVRIALMVAGTIGLLAVAAALLVIDPSPSSPAGSGAAAFDGSIRPPGPPLDFRLTDERGAPATLRALRGRPAIVTFMYTKCESDCPTMAQQIRGALDDLGPSRQVPVIAVSVDPQSDTPARALRFLAAQRLAGRMRFALGDRASLQPAWRSFGVQPQERGREHAAWVVLLDRSGRQRIGFPASKLTSEGIENDVRLLLAEPRQ